MRQSYDDGMGLDRAAQLIRLAVLAHSYSSERITLSTRSKSKDQMFYVYILKDSDNNLYIGQTNNLQRRENEQTIKNNKTAKFIREGANFALVYCELYLTRLEAMRREKQLKGWTRAKKEALIKGDLELLKKL